MNRLCVESGPCAVWIVVNTQTNREALAERNLLNQHYEVYQPLIRKQVRHARRVQHVLRPLFPGYLFVRFNPSETRWRPILSTPGVRSVVRTGDVPCLVAERLIADLKAREKDGVIARSASPRQIGEAVRVAHGPFDGLIGRIIELPENDRLVVLMHFLNRPVEVRISEDHLSAC
jgi:transcriptional antiterminator RfaH